MLKQRQARGRGRPPKPAHEHKVTRTISLSPLMAKAVDDLDANISVMAEKGLAIMLAFSDPAVKKVIAYRDGDSVRHYIVDGYGNETPAPGEDDPALVAELVPP